MTVTCVTCHRSGSGVTTLVVVVLVPFLFYLLSASGFVASRSRTLFPEPSVLSTDSSLGFDNNHSSTDDSGLHCADETGSWEARDSVENDEVIAHALQEELSQIAMHVPRINKELPSVDEEISDHQRLLERVTSFGG
ncbi:OTU-like cysteine protease [Musa troglodytarum]|uniref:OTU-like cysteine protease n=1 Tax=Musa troglodytarum TaxID=320322 RepID=A0A9E7HQ64_9LILI|nr:OTU-like cysteine protease [Musa troglodytarum]